MNAKETFDLCNELLEASIGQTNAIRRLITVIAESIRVVAEPPPKKKSNNIKAAAEPQQEVFYRNDNNLIRINGKKYKSCSFDVVEWLVAEMYARNGLHQNLSTTDILREKKVGGDSSTVITAWLKDIGLIRRMGGGFRLRNDNKEESSKMMKRVFDVLPELPSVYAKH